MEQATYDRGREIRTAVLGEAYVQQAAIYAGLPAGVDGFGIARAAFAELDGPADQTDR